jgi:hypothetical protein
MTTTDPCQAIPDTAPPAAMAVTWQPSLLDPSAALHDTAAPAAMANTAEGSDRSIRRLVAIDYGTPLMVATGPDRDQARRARVHSDSGRNKRRDGKSEDVVQVIGENLAQGHDVGTEATTPTSFGARGHEDRLAAFVARSPGRLYTIATRRVQNRLRAAGVEYDSSTDDDLAAATIWAIINDPHQAKRLWTPERLDDSDVRPHKALFIRLRSDRYPTHAMRRLVTPYMPKDLADGPEWDLFQGGYHPERCAAFITSLREPGASSRRGWERVVGAYADGYPSVYRQVLMSGAGGQGDDYVRGQHYAVDASMQRVLRVMRNLRTRIGDVHGLPIPTDPQELTW